MKRFLNNIRSAENPIPLNKQIINTICIFFIGIILGTFSKFLDTMPTNELPFNLRIDNIPFCNSVLKRKTIKDTMIMLALSVGIAFALDFVVPFHFG